MMMTTLRLILGIWIILQTSVVIVDASYRFADLIYHDSIHGVDMTLLADLPPPNSLDSSNVRHWNRTEELLSTCWEPLAGFASTDIDHALRCYGEVTVLGTRQLAHAMDMTEEQNQMENDGIIFYDLGSGVGRLTSQVYLDQPHLVQKAVGIELSTDRHAIAVDAWNCIANMHASSSSTSSLPPIHFIHGDILKEDWQEATHIFLSSLCFPDMVLESIQQQILGNLASSSSLRVVASLNRLNLLYRHEQWSETEVPIQMSWGPGSAKIYRRLI